MRKARVGREKAGLGAEAETKKLPVLQPEELRRSATHARLPTAALRLSPARQKRERFFCSQRCRGGAGMGKRKKEGKKKKRSRKKHKVLHFGRLPAFVQKFKRKKVQMHPFPRGETGSVTNDRYTGTYPESVHTRLTKRVWKSHLHHQKRVRLVFF